MITHLTISFSLTGNPEYSYT